MIANDNVHRNYIRREYFDCRISIYNVNEKIWEAFLLQAPGSWTTNVKLLINSLIAING